MLEYLEALSRCQSLEEVWPLHCDTMETYGFDRIMYGFTRFISGESFGPRADALMLTNHDAAYSKRFFDGELYKNAPMARWAATNTGACSWSWISENLSKLNEKERAVYEFNRSMGVTAGYTIGFADASTRARGAIGLAAKRGCTQEEVDQYWEKYGREIMVINNMAHLKIINLPHGNDRPKLSRRQLEVLEWVGDGKTNQDIGQILGIKPATIEKHLRLAREKLDVETTAQAVMKASFLNQMFVL